MASSKFEVGSKEEVQRAIARLFASFTGVQNLPRAFRRLPARSSWFVARHPRCTARGHAATRSDRAHTPVCPGRCEILPNAAAYGRGPRNCQASAEFRKFNPSNYRASRKGRSREEFQAKLQITFEEADECVDCLEFLRDARIKSNAALLQEANEIAKILGASVKTARQNTARLKNRPKSYLYFALTYFARTSNFKPRTSNFQQCHRCVASPLSTMTFSTSPTPLRRR